LYEIAGFMASMNLPKTVIIEIFARKHGYSNVTVTSTVKTGSNGVPVGWGWGGPLLMMIGDAMTPFDPTGGPV